MDDSDQVIANDKHTPDILLSKAEDKNVIRK